MGLKNGVQKNTTDIAVLKEKIDHLYLDFHDFKKEIKEDREYALRKYTVYASLIGLGITVLNYIINNWK